MRSMLPMLPMGAGLRPGNQTRTSNVGERTDAHGGRRARTEGSLRGGMSTATGLDRRFLGIVLPSGLTECWFC